MLYPRIIYRYNHAVEAIGIVLILSSIPLLLRWVRPNRFFGFRIPATLRDESVWYDTNALCARHMLALGLLLVGLEFVLPVSARIPLLRVIATVGFFGIIIADWRTALGTRATQRCQGGSIGRPVAGGLTAVLRTPDGPREN